MTTELIQPVLIQPVAEVDGPPVAVEKKTRQMTFTVLDNGDIRADFGEGVEPVLMSPTTLPEALASAALTEGLISRLRSYTSKLTDDTRTPENLRAAIAKGVENLQAGIWKVAREGGAGVEYPMEVEAAFLFRQMRAKAKGETDESTIEQAAAAWKELTEDQIKALKDLPRYKLALAEVKAARNAAKAKALAAKLDKEGDDTGF